MKERVLVVGPLSSGHIQKWVKPLLNEFDFIFFTLHRSENDKVLEGMPIISFPRVTSTRIDFLLAVPLLIYTILKYSPNLLHAHFLSSYGLMVSMCDFKNIPKILSTWGTDVNGKAQTNKLLRYFLKRAVSNYNIINAPAHHIKEKLQTLGFKGNNIEVFQYGINLTEYPVKECTQEKSDQMVFLSIRNWDDLYNIKSVLIAFSMFSKESKNKATLRLVGKGDLKTKAAIEGLVKTLYFGDNEVDIIGFVDNESLKRLLLASDFVVSIPSIDGTPLSVLESIYVGLIPIVSDIDANREWFCEKTAIFVDQTEVTSIVRGFHRGVELLAKSISQSMIIENRNKVIEKACYNTNTNRLKFLYNSLLTKKND